MALIDLGVASHDAPEPAAPVNVPRIRRLVPAAAAIAGLLVVGGAAPAEPGLVRPLWTAPLHDDESVTLTDDTAYLGRKTNGGEGRLTAYDLSTGAMRWTARTGPGVTDFGAAPAAGVVLVAADPDVVAASAGDGTYYFAFSRTTIALDARTGAERWRTAGEARPCVVDGAALITEYDGAGRPIRLRRVRLADGHELWSRPTPGTTAWTVRWRADRPTDIVTAGATGEIRSYRWADGEPGFSGRLPWRIGRSQSTDIYAAGDYLVVDHREMSSATTAVYRPGDLRELWRTSDPTGYVTGCGPLLCTVSQTTVIGRDPETGQERWRQNGNAVVELSADRLRVDQTLGDDTQLVVDAVTGRPVGRPAIGQPASAHSDYGAGAPGGSLFVLRPTREPLGRLAVTRVDVATGKQALLGMVGPTGALPCVATAGYLACRYAGVLTVTAVG